MIPLYVLAKKVYAKGQPRAFIDQGIDESLDLRYNYILLEFFDTKEAAAAKAGPTDQISRISSERDTILVRVEK